MLERGASSQPTCKSSSISTIQPSTHSMLTSWAPPLLAACFTAKPMHADGFNSRHSLGILLCPNARCQMLPAPSRLDHPQDYSHPSSNRPPTLHTIGVLDRLTRLALTKRQFCAWWLPCMARHSSTPCDLQQTHYRSIFLLSSKSKSRAPYLIQQELVTPIVIFFPSINSNCHLQCIAVFPFIYNFLLLHIVLTSHLLLLVL